MNESGSTPGAFRGWHAYVDESLSDGRLDPDTYMLAAAVGDADGLGQARELMRDLLQAGQRKLHWRDESDKRRFLVIAAVARAPLEYLVVVYKGRRGESLGRRRGQCLKRLCFELDQSGVTRMVLESRGTKDDQRDRKTIDAFRASKTVSGALRMEHASGPAEPLLWLPDAVCGAMTRARTGEPAFTTPLKSKLTVIGVSYAE
jgi:hypothetical protein